MCVCLLYEHFCAYACAYVRIRDEIAFHWTIQASWLYVSTSDIRICTAYRVTLFPLCLIHMQSCKSRSGVEWHVVSLALCMYVHICYLYSKDGVLLGYIMVAHQFHCLCYCLCLQDGFTAILEATHNDHLTVLRTLVEQYGGNVLHREKVKSYIASFTKGET